MRGVLRRGFTLVELLVVIAIVVTLVGLLFPSHAGSSGELARQNTCRNNLWQLQKAITVRESNFGNYPGYINKLGLANGPSTRASWVVSTFPYVEQDEIWDRWSQGKPKFTPIEILQCPSDPYVEIDQPYLSYVANSGFIANVDGVENQANGVFFDRTRIADGAAGPADERDEAGSPLITMTSAYIQKHDGANRTLLLAENVRALHWGYTTAKEQAETLDRKYHFGFCWEQPAKVDGRTDTGDSLRRFAINSNFESDDYTSFEQMRPSDGFPSINHPGGVNVAFVGGSVRFLSEDIDPLVFAQLMTSNHKASDLVSREGKPDSEIVQPADRDY